MGGIIRFVSCEPDATPSGCQFFFKLHYDRLVRRSWLAVTYHHPILLCLLLIPIFNPNLILNEESRLSPVH